MIQKYVDRFMARKHILRKQFEKSVPNDWQPIVEGVVELISHADPHDAWDGDMDAKNIHRIDDGDYQGTLLFLIPEDTYQPEEYWFVRIGYGSCSGCDTLLNLVEYVDYDDPGERERVVDGLMMLALQVVQNLRALPGS